MWWSYFILVVWCIRQNKSIIILSFFWTSWALIRALSGLNESPGGCWITPAQFDWLSLTLLENVCLNGSSTHTHTHINCIPFTLTLSLPEIIDTEMKLKVLDPQVNPPPRWPLKHDFQSYNVNALSRVFVLTVMKCDEVVYMQWIYRIPAFCYYSPRVE